MGGVLNRWWIFAIALAVRGVVAFVFFGSVDVTNSMLDAGRLLDGVPPSRLTVPYFPGVQAVIWTAGVISVTTAVPVAFLYKFFGCLFDAVIAAAIFDHRGRSAGLLYAFAPVPVLIFSIHGQWDAISLGFFIAGLLVLRRPGRVSSALTGALYVLALIAKPIVVPFVVFLFPSPWQMRDREERLRVLLMVAGMSAMFAVYKLVLQAAGDPLELVTVAYVLDYARGGVTYFGLPFALGIQQNRLFLIASLLLLLPLYWSKRLEREEAITLAYAFILGTCGLSMQYLSWIVPFLLLRGHFRFAALYSALAGVFLVLMYSSVGTDLITYQNLGAFAPLRGLAWLAPGATHAVMKTYLILAIGDVVLPLACVGWLAAVGWRLVVRRDSVPAHLPTANLGPLVAALAITVGLFLYALDLPRPDARTFERRTRAKVNEYHAVRIADTRPGEPAWVVPDAAGLPHRSTIDASVLAYAWIGAWSCAAYLTAARMRL